jgi:DNA polymerase elongation subunit (family B)
MAYHEITKLCIESGKLLSEFIKKILRGTLNLQFEKVLTNFFLFSKKHYIGYLHEKNEIDRELKYKGIILVRRDNPEIAKHLFRKIFKYIDNNS